jgi:hypothetical protein
VLEYLKQLEPVLTILVGWLLGVLTPGIVERIRRPYRSRDLRLAVVDEMLGLQYKMAIIAHQVRMYFAEATNAFIDGFCRSSKSIADRTAAKSSSPSSGDLVGIRKRSEPTYTELGVPRIWLLH